MKSITKLGALIGALICLTTFGSSQAAQAHDGHWDRARQVERVREYRRVVDYNCAVNSHPILSQVLWRLGL
jgi:hypothetical protein